MKKALLIIIILAIVSIEAAYIIGYKVGRSQSNGITSYEQCVAAGYPVMESYPEQCRTPEGKNFVRDINKVVPPTEGVACTMEAKICPDGSAVGRIPPKCEFAPCPTRK